MIRRTKRLVSILDELLYYYYKHEMRIESQSDVKKLLITAIFFFLQGHTQVPERALGLRSPPQSCCQPSSTARWLTDIVYLDAVRFDGSPLFWMCDARITSELLIPSSKKNDNLFVMESRAGSQSSTPSSIL